LVFNFQLEMEFRCFIHLTLTLVVLQLPGDQCMVLSGKRYVSTAGRLAVTPVTSVTFKGRGTKLGCVVWCQKTSGCLTVNHQWNAATSSVTCEALSVYLHQVPGGTTAAAGWSFLQEGKTEFLVRTMQ
jgi:hypothetical protein